MTKQCTKCGQDKPLEEFYRGSTRSFDGRRGACRVCDSELQRVRRKSEKYRATKQRYREAHIQEIREYDRVAARWRKSREAQREQVVP